LNHVASKGHASSAKNIAQGNSSSTTVSMSNSSPSHHHKASHTSDEVVFVGSTGTTTTSIFDGFAPHVLAHTVEAVVTSSGGGGITSIPPPFFDAFACACMKKGFAAFSPSELTTITMSLAKDNADTTTGFWDHSEEWYISTGFNGMDDAKTLTTLIH